MEHAPPNRPPDLASERRHHALVVLLAVTTGALDALGFLALGGVFASVMTGNLVLLGLGAGTRDGGLATHALVAIGGYVVGVSVGARATRGTRVTPATVVPSWSRRLHGLVVAELALVVVFAVGWELIRNRHATPGQLVLVAVAATAMGLQSAAVRVSTGNGRSTTYLTGTLTGAVMALAGGDRRRVDWPDLAVLVAALGGAALAGAVLTVSSPAAPAVPVVALVGALVVGRPMSVASGSGTGTGTGTDGDDVDAGPPAP